MKILHKGGRLNIKVCELESLYANYHSFGSVSLWSTEQVQVL